MPINPIFRRAGNSTAQNQLGWMYQKGRGVPQDDAEAVRRFRLAAEKGNAQAQNNLGWMYEKGRGVPQDDAEAVRRYRLAADQGNATAQSNLGWMYERGRGVPQHDAETVRWHRLAAEQGDASAQNSLGWMYEKGRGVPQDDAEAVRWYQLAAEQGSAIAQTNLGWMYERGRGVPQDDAEAVRWYRLAAEQGYARAQNNLGVMYEDGRGVPQDDAEAVRWYRLAAEQGYARAQNNLGFMHEHGRGVPQDDTEALRWYRLAAEQDKAAGRAHLGVALVRGIGTDTNREEGWRLIGLAAKEEGVSALLALAARYRLGLDTVPDHTAARAFYQRAIEAGGAADGHLGLLALDFSGPPEAVREALLRVAREFPEGGSFIGGQARDAAIRLLEAARASSLEGAAEAVALLDRHDPLKAAVDPVRWRTAVAPVLSSVAAATNNASAATPTRATVTSVPSSMVTPPTGSAGAGAAASPFAALVGAELTAERGQIAALITAGTFNDELVRRQERVVELVRLTGDTDGALAEKLTALRYREVRASLDWGSTDNYFVLLDASCRWSEASRWARQLERPGAALFMAKQAVNRLQDARRRLVDLNENLRECFLKAQEDRYRRLADLFVELGRLGEAETVIRMLKDFETYEYVRRDPGSAGKAYDHLPLDQPEGALGTALGGAGLVQAALALERRDLLKQKIRGEPDSAVAARLTEVQRLLEEAERTARADFDRVRVALVALERSGDERSIASRDLLASGSVQGLLKSQFRGEAAALHMVVLPDRVHVIVTTADTQIVRTTSVEAAELGRLVLALREAVQSPGRDPRPAAQRLYDLLLRPVAAELAASQAKLLLLSLDHLLRYVPFAALHDGERYLAERYALTLFTEAARTNLARQNAVSWEAAGFGVTAAPGFTPLPAVAEELRAIVRAGNDGEGLLPGRVYLDQSFTGARFRDAAQAGFPVVHVASHFVLRPGDARDGFLLLGDGGRLTVEELRRIPLAGVDLLALSACETAVGRRDGDGRELESLGVLAQERGAGAVMATLWPVADASTARFMRLFYQARVETGLSKAAALQAAMRAFLAHSGEAQQAAADPGRGAEVVGSPRPTVPAGTAHPYHWAPFVLIGSPW
ncbi:CHAT domain-containing protein [Azospirillum sp. OGB3]|uniref:CHAT domain-containing protein n=1 Tax=Azospirillum sp. OGB3 TaxID=2587012 RepID=UPI002494568D|nr:CHAT domain-containing protein [Azospirillum sp. OGB3]